MHPVTMGSCMLPASSMPDQCIATVAAGASLDHSGGIAVMRDLSSTLAELAIRFSDQLMDRSSERSTAVGSVATVGTTHVPGWVDGSDFSQWASASVQIMTGLPRPTGPYVKAYSTDLLTGGINSNQSGRVALARDDPFSFVKIML